MATYRKVLTIEAVFYDGTPETLKPIMALTKPLGGQRLVETVDGVSVLAFSDAILERPAFTLKPGMWMVRRGPVFFAETQVAMSQRLANGWEEVTN